VAMVGPSNGAALDVFYPQVSDETPEVLRIASMLDNQLGEHLDDLSAIVAKKYAHVFYSRASVHVQEFYLSGRRFSFFAWPLPCAVLVPSPSSSSSIKSTSSPASDRSSLSSSATEYSSCSEESEEEEMPLTPLTPLPPAYSTLDPMRREKENLPLSSSEGSVAKLARQQRCPQHQHHHQQAMEGVAAGFQRPALTNATMWEVNVLPTNGSTYAPA
jgi:hypothetical protein